MAKAADRHRRSRRSVSWAQHDKRRAKKKNENKKARREEAKFNAKEGAILFKLKSITLSLKVSQHAPSSPEKGDFVSIIFFRPKCKRDGSHRTILILKQFNVIVEYHHFKMDMLETAIGMMKPGCYKASVDLRDANYTIPIDPSHQKSLNKFCSQTTAVY